MRYFLFSFFFLIAFLASAQTTVQPEQRCRYRPSREFLLSKSDTCFDITRREADRAFAARCWDEAGSLYRAAKSCADANQKNRSDMNKRIEACRDSAEQELRRSEQAARRQYLHAVAANLADEATELLKLYDRSTAYRLADFAAQYVAPGPNADCQQALLDAWYYVPPSQQTGQEQEGTKLQVPFCYELDYDLGRNVQARFGGKGKSLTLYAFAPATHTLYAWDAESFKPRKPIQLEEGIERFEISPDGLTLVFFSKNSLLFWRGAERNYKLDLSNRGPNATAISRYSFNAQGDKFLFYDGSRSQVYEFDLDIAFEQGRAEQKNLYKQSNVELRSPLSLILSSIDYEVLGLAYSEGRVWLGGRDSLFVLEKTDKKWGQYKVERAMHWNASASYGEATILIFPDAQRAVFLSSQSATIVPLMPSQEPQQNASHGLEYTGTPLAVRHDAALIAIAQPSYSDILCLYESSSGAVRHGAFLHPYDQFASMNGAFSPDEKLFAAATENGVLKIWTLAELQSDESVSLGTEMRTVFSQNDEYFSRYKDGTVQVCLTDEPNKSLFSFGGVSDGISLQAVSKNWVAYSTPDSILVVKNGVTGKKWTLPMKLTVPVSAIDEHERYVAYTVSDDSIAVRSLETGEFVAGKAFNGYVNNFYFFPNGDEILVVQRDAQGYLQENQFVAKFWNLASPKGERLRAVRLHGYNISLAAISPDGKQVAFGDTKDIRVFSADNLNDESTRIRPINDHYAVAFAFSPDGSALAAGYDDGRIIVWDLASGESRFQLKTNKFWIEKLSFSRDGSRLRAKTMEGELFFRDIEPALIRKAAQNENRRLVAFTPEQIRGWGLEKALDDSGNFQRLAESHDLPLIRSFFEYYRLQALSSNNIEKVKTYFESSASLYSKLDDPAAQQALRPTMTEIYDDYIWKLLLRGKNEEATRVLNDFNRVLGKPLAAVKAGAHTSLLRGELASAAEQYVEWTMRACDASSSDLPVNWTLDTLRQRFRQLAEYDMLDQKQQDCICGLYANILEIKSLCPNSASVAAPLDAETSLRWNVFQTLFNSSRVLNHSKKVKLLEATLADAASLSRKNPVRQELLEKTTLALAEALTSWGAFEQENDYSAALYQRALSLLDTFGVFKTNEPARLKALTINHWRLGNYYVATNRFAEAARQCERGLAFTDNLLRSAPPDSVALYRNYRQAPLLAQLGMARLLEGNAAAARTAFEQTNEAMIYGLNSYYFGHVALLEGKEDEAINLYKGVNDESDLGRILFEINRLAGRFPERRTRLERFQHRLRDAILSERPEMMPEAVDYYYATQQTAYASANKQWAVALDWNEKGLADVDSILRRTDAPGLWKSERLNILLAKSFYLLFTAKNDPAALDKSIRTAEQAEIWATEEYPYYAYRNWLKTNLAHAYLLRNQPGDREAAIAIYRSFLETPAYDRDNWELLQKDFRDLHRAGLHWPNLKEVVTAIKPADLDLTDAEWREMGVEPAGN